MPRPAKGARLYLRKRFGREPSWVILDKGNEIATGWGESSREEAEKALSEYIEGKYEAPQGPCHPDKMTINQALEIYGAERAPHVASPVTISYHIEALLPYWDWQPISSIKGETCRGYVRHRKSVKPATARRELETLSAAINYCHKEGYVTFVPRLTYPPKGKSRIRWLTRKEAARLLWAARREPHLRTFILIALYTGTRASAVLNLQWMPNTTGGWVDLERGTLFRGAEGRVESNKRQPPCPLPTKLLGHLRRSRSQTRRYVVEYLGSHVGKLRNSWRTACKRAGLGEDVTPHTLRHTAVTWRLQRGVKIWEVAGYVGMSEKMVRDHYGHHCPDFLQEARDAI